MTTLDCELLGDLFGTAEARELLSSTATAQGWLDAERALAQAEADVGVIPRKAAERIAQECDASSYDLATLGAAITQTKHPLVPLVRALAERCGEWGAWVHWGATTQDIMDTGLVLQIRRALMPIERDAQRARVAASELALRHQSVPMAGRTHGQHAVPITFGLKAASWTDELERGLDRLAAAREGVLVSQLWGAAGTLATLGESAEAVQARFAERLGLQRTRAPWHAVRDRLRDLGHALAELAAADERIASEVIRLEATDVAEVAEPATTDHVGSSTMPQKRNPMTCEYAVATARLMRGSTHVLDQAAAHAHERDMGLWAVEWIAVPQALILSAGLADKLAQVLEGLHVDIERMVANLAATDGAIMAEAVMMALACKAGHESAHEIVSAVTRRAQDTGRPLFELLAEDSRIADALTPSDLARLGDPRHYLGLAPEVTEAVIQSTTRRAGA